MKMKTKLTDLRIHQLLPLRSQLSCPVVGRSSETGFLMSASYLLEDLFKGTLAASWAATAHPSEASAYLGRKEFSLPGQGHLESPVSRMLLCPQQRLLELRCHIGSLRSSCPGIKVIVPGPIRGVSHRQGRRCRCRCRGWSRCRPHDLRLFGNSRTATNTESKSPQQSRQVMRVQRSFAHSAVYASVPTDPTVSSGGRGGTTCHLELNTAEKDISL